MTKTFHFYAGHYFMGVINAPSLMDAYDQAVELCHSVDWRIIVVVPTTLAYACAEGGR